MATQTHHVRATGWLLFASLYLAIAGAFNLIWGITALSKKSYFHEGGLVWSSLDTWGWIALLIAVGQIVVAGLIYTQRTAGMILGIVFAMAGTLVNFASIGAYPVWSAAAIVCSLLVLWAVTVHWEEP
jgi:hypothetical protein